MSLNKNNLTYISLFSGAGIGCYGFKKAGFECIATNEIIERRLDVQRFNQKCKYNTGYLCKDISTDETKMLLRAQVDKWRKNENISDFTVIVATPPCQGMSVANHKKAENEIIRNSLVIESVKVISEISPMFFVFENVPQFMKTICTDIDGIEKPISEAIDTQLGERYSIYSQVINFKNYGACCSRSRTLVIGVRNDLADFISPIELFPDFIPEKTLKATIGHLKPLKTFGEIDTNDIYHAFRVYPEYMRSWISDLKEGESAFDNEDINKKPHQIIDGKIVVNQRKNGDKYRRQIWDKVGPCIHTRNDQLASQNTIHPADDRVFSIRELMLMMTIPNDFKWSDTNIIELNAMPNNDKRSYLRKEEMNIRQCIGEGVPTAIMQGIADKMRGFVSHSHLSTAGVKNLAKTENLSNSKVLQKYISDHSSEYGISTLSKIAEYSNAEREKNAAFYTDKSIMTEIIKCLPSYDKSQVRVLEPSVGTGNFIPFILKKYESVPQLIVDVVDIDESTLDVLKCLIKSVSMPDNVTFNFICDDFLLHKFECEYDLIIGNPPFKKLNTTDKKMQLYQSKCYNTDTTNIFSFFLEKAMKLGGFVSMITPKNLLNTPEFKKTRDLMEKKRIASIIDFGEKGFKDVLIETICINIDTKRSPTTTAVKSIAEHYAVTQKQRYITEKTYPYWIIYRNDFFDEIARKMEFDVFTVFRDRQITNALLKDKGDIRVIKSRNINDNGTEILSIPDYDSFISREVAANLSVYKFFSNDTVYLTPNMTYKPRVITKPKNTLVNGSVAILQPRDGVVISEKQRLYFSTEEYRKFYKIARNYQTRSLNVDSSSVFFFGLQKED